MSGSIFKQGNFEIEKMINNKGYSPRISSSKPNKIITLDNKKGYHVFDGLENLDGYMIVLKDSLVNNTQAVINNTMVIRRVAVPEEYELYEDVLEDAAIESFRMVNSCIINNNTENTNVMIQDLKEVLNDSEYIRKKGAMICGTYYSTDHNNDSGINILREDI